MKERPILFSGPMVRAILEGRKTQTRRVVMPQFNVLHQIRKDCAILTNRIFRRGDGWIKSPYGQPGDRLWVRETWVELLHTSPGSDQPELCEGDKLIEPATSYVGADGKERWTYSGRVIAYRSTSKVEFCDGDGFVGEMADKEDMPRWKPSIHMPRWASRITLEITSIRVERVNEITADDAEREGCGFGVNDETGGPVARFWKLWESINGTGSWDSNPWVWAITFNKL